MPDKVIVIEGYGSVSALGHNQSTVRGSYESRKSSFCSCEGLPVGSLSDEANEALEQLVATNSKYRGLDRSVLMAIYASRQAIASAGWEDGRRIGINIGSSRGATTSFEQFHRSFQSQGRVPANTSPLTTLGNISSWVGQDLKLRGACISHSVTCSTGLQSIANAFAWLKSGMEERFLAGAAEAPITPFTLAQMKALGIYSGYHPSSYPCRPYNAGARNTFTLGEGAAVFALSKLTEAERMARPVPPLVIEAVGFGFEEIASKTGISARGEHFAEAINSALHNSNCKEPVDMIIAHAPGTVAGDRAEMEAIIRVFAENQRPVIISNKWLTGHTLGASGCLSMEYAVSILRGQRWLEFPYQSSVSNPQKASIRKILITAAGFGGNAAAVVLRV